MPNVRQQQLVSRRIQSGKIREVLAARALIYCGVEFETYLIQTRGNMKLQGVIPPNRDALAKAVGQPKVEQRSRCRVQPIGRQAERISNVGDGLRAPSRHEPYIRGTRR
jgi:hypothetical protein